MKSLFRLWTSAPSFNLWSLLAVLLGLGICFSFLDESFETVSSEMNSLCAAAYKIYESGGSYQLLPVLKWVEEGLNIKAYLLDANGKDLATGNDRSRLMSAARNSSRAIPGLNTVFIAPAASSYACIVEKSPETRRFPLTVLVFSFLLISCCTIASYVTVRMRRIEAAVNRFGSEGLCVRLTPESGDPIGRVSGAFNQMANRIQTLVSSHQQLSADISHELRSPLARLLLAVRSGRRGVPGTLDRIEREASRMRDLLDELLDLASAEVDPTAIHLEEVDLQEILSEIVDRCAPEALARNCRIVLMFSRPGQITADPELLSRAVENVLRNAIRYNPPGSPIEVSAGGDGEYVFVTIRDRGRGVPDEALDDIFRPLYRVERSRTRRGGGAGLGLAIARRAITIHGGTIRADNCSPGLRIEIRLRRRRASQAGHNS